MKLRRILVRTKQRWRGQTAHKTLAAAIGRGSP
jgi:hypothetical protein